MNSGSFTPHTVSPMQHLQAVIVRSSRPLRFSFGEQESETHPRTQMSDRPTHSPQIHFFRIVVTHYFSLGLKTLGPWVRNLAHLLCSSIYTILKQDVRRQGNYPPFKSLRSRVVSPTPFLIIYKHTMTLLSRLTSTE